MENRYGLCCPNLRAVDDCEISWVDVVIGISLVIEEFPDKIREVKLADVDTKQVEGVRLVSRS